MLLLRRSFLLVAAVLPLIVVPQLPEAFSTPKIAALGIVLVAGSLLAWRARILEWPPLPAYFQVALAAWFAALGLSASLGAFASPRALLLPLSAAAWFLLVQAVRPRAEALLAALALSATAVSLVALLQFFGLDPFVLFGWRAAGGSSARMHVYATLGNPNFVAAFLVSVLPATLFAATSGRRARLAFGLFAALQLAAIAATGSRAAALALVAAAVWTAVLKKLPRWPAIVAGVLLASLALILLSPARPLSATIQGRFYVWRAVAAHATEIPLLGFGPGAFLVRYTQWEMERWNAGPPAGNAAPFAGVHDHAHNDYLEFLVDYGPVGLAAFLGVVGAFLLSGYRQARASGNAATAAATAGVVALLAVALVDFPFNRPAEQFVFWTLMAATCLAASGSALEAATKVEV